MHNLDASNDFDPDRDAYPSSWLETPDDFDPRFGKAFDDHRPGHALRARVVEIAALYLNQDSRAGHMIADLDADAQQALQDDHRAYVKVLHGLYELLAVHITGASGKELAVGRLCADCDTEREAARLDYAIEHNL